MNLYELAFTCYIYNFFTTFNQTYKELQKATDYAVDLKQKIHRKALIVWLNKWGCRQFALNYHDEASNELLAWYQEGHIEKLTRNKKLWELNLKELSQVGDVFNSLVCRVASRPDTNGKVVTKTFGPTGASKILFALRPDLTVPWDSYIRINLGFSGDGNSYVEYLKRLIEEIEELNESCLKNGHYLHEVQMIIKRDESTIPQLVGEYFWVIETRKCYPPDRETIKEWAEWSVRHVKTR